MGRSLSGAFGAGSTSGIGQGAFKLKAGVAINQNDMVELGPNGKAFPVQCTDNAAVANCTYGTAQTSEATGRIVAQTSVVAGQTLAYSRQAVVQGSDGSIFTLTNNSGVSGMLLSRYSSAGALITSAIIDASNTYVNQHLFFLSNGNICAVGFSTGGAGSGFAIFDANLSVVKSLTAFSENAETGYCSTIALSGGGFAVVYQSFSSPLLSRLVTFDNTGTAVLAPTTIWTRTGTTGTQYHRMAQLSNGNLVIAVSSANTVSNIGLYQGIVTTAGASVLAFTSLDGVLANTIPDISVMGSYYAVARVSSTGALAFVFNNAGGLQGAGFNGGGGSATINTFKLLNDGTNFWFIWARTSDSNEVLTKIPVTGADVVTSQLRGGSNIYGLPVDAFAENGLIVIVSQPAGTTQPVLWVADTVTGSLLSQSATSFGMAPTATSGRYHRVIPGGDFSLICLYDYASTAATHLAVGKYANTAVMGVAQSSGVADDLVSVAGISGGYAVNYVKGSPSKSFDHSATNIMGNKGTMMNYGTVLKGF